MSELNAETTTHHAPISGFSLDAESRWDFWVVLVFCNVERGVNCTFGDPGVTKGQTVIVLILSYKHFSFIPWHTDRIAFPLYFEVENGHMA